MIPYRGRLALRIARMALAVAGLAWYLRGPGLLSFALNFTWVTAVLAAYTVYSVGALLEIKFDTPVRAAIGSTADAAFFALWVWLEPAGWPPAMACALLLGSAVLLSDLPRMSAAAGVALFLTLVLPSVFSPGLVWTVCSESAMAVALAWYKRYLWNRMSNTLRHNVIIRSQAEGAREAERQRIAADFHDGPLQSFISFQMRLEIVRKLFARDTAAAAEELHQLQDLCRSQVAELRSFVRSMRPTDEGMSLAASLSRMADSFQRDTGISASVSAGDIADPEETEVSLELLQIVREALNNIQKHSGASRIVLRVARREQRLEMIVEDNGGGFPFCGAFTLEELELLRLGPVSIKRRVRMLNGDLTLESRPAQGARLEIRIPV
jgi:signal transduction histidine kinase